MQITIQSARNIFGKRQGGFVASLESETASPIGDVRGPTKTEAKTRLLEYLHAIEVNHRTRRYVICGDGLTILVVHWNAAGWAYDIIDRERTHTSGCMTCETSIDRVVKQASAHAEQSYGGVVRVI